MKTLFRGRGLQPLAVADLSATAVFLLPEAAYSQQDGTTQNPIANRNVREVIAQGKAHSGQKKQKGASVVDFAQHASVLDKFKDCSAELWFDEKRRRLMGSGLELPVPKQAIRSVADRYVIINIRVRFHGFPAEWLLVPMSPQRNDSSEQNSMGVRARINDIRAVLSDKWGAKFVKGTPDGPDDRGVAYFSDPPQWRPSLASNSYTAVRSAIDCAFRFSSGKK